MIKISEFVNKALFSESGYYRKKNPLGKDGDFITAPEISQVFGEMLALYILQILTNKNHHISLVEMGAGKATLFYDILITINKLSKNNNIDFLEKTQLHIIEINDELIKIQQDKLKEFKVIWHKNFAEFLDKTSEKQEIIFITNELFDCFAIDQYVKTDIGWCERMIEERDGKFAFALSLFDIKKHQFVESLIGLEKSSNAPFGAVFEYSKSAREFMMQLCKALEKRGGVAINFDYGYVENEFANTLQAIKNHQKTNILESAGECDITALVDFLSLKEIAQSFNLNSSLISQREFLLSLGIEERRKKLLQGKTAKEQNEINLAIDRTIDEDKMGKLFKCLIIWK